MRAVETVDGEVVFATHMVWVKDENRPHGRQHQACPGSGTKPGRVVHSAEISLNARRNV
jgi:hypothetical protein